MRSGDVQINGGSFSIIGDVGDTPASGAGTRYMWVPSKRAIRAGDALADEWDDANIGTYSVAIGLGPSATETGSVALGFGATSIAARGFAIGTSASCSGPDALAIGAAANSSGEDAVSVGNAADSQGEGSVAVGSSATAVGLSALAFGLNSTAGNREDIAIGTGATATNSIGGANAGNLAIGTSSTSTALFGGVAVGFSSSAGGPRGSAIGYFANASGVDSLSFGASSTATAFNSTAVGPGSQSTGVQSSAVGYQAVASAEGSTAVGASSSVSALRSICIGAPSAAVAAPQSVAINSLFNVNELNAGTGASTNKVLMGGNIFISPNNEDGSNLFAIGHQIEAFGMDGGDTNSTSSGDAFFFGSGLNGTGGGTTATQRMVSFWPQNNHLADGNAVGGITGGVHLGVKSNTPTVSITGPSTIAANETSIDDWPLGPTGNVGIGGGFFSNLDVKAKVHINNRDSQLAFYVEGGTGSLFKGPVGIERNDLTINQGDAYLNQIEFNPTAGSTTNGRLWYDETREAIQTYASDIEQTLVGTTFTQTANRTISSSNTETTLFAGGIGTVTLPANFFTVGKSIKITLAGYNSSVSAVTGTWRVRLGGTGGTIIMASDTVTLSTVTQRGWSMEAILTCRSVGGSGTVVGGGFVHRQQGSGTPSRTFIMKAPGTPPAPATVDTTSSLNVTPSFQFGTASASNIMVTSTAMIEILN